MPAPASAPRRGRPPAFDRDEVLAAATRLFWQHGYEATSVTDLTSAMGIRPGSLYAAFGDKESLFEEVVRRYGRSPVGAFVTVALEEEPTAHDAFARILREAAAVYADPSHPAGCLMISAATNVTPQDAGIQDRLRELRNGNLRTFEERLRRARQDGELPPEADPKALAGYFGTVLQGMSQQARDGATTADLTRIAELALRAWP
ncbi:TetR/AcrR family transcriptional regulator [Streptomyces sp. CBMA156]|uniref:TetR/AcrR family transcriptional regulator n=1 Tax=Streptomyces sp. CBMA156 TaxID=1930280 RepID=UPI001661C885|nr:TetR/AcrR family transcriptional regulator [Streptomyces sp. CBMA156]MBD0675609.1 TetR family transcriptional regulator [Streptomyces sp. CBMA156]